MEFIRSIISIYLFSHISVLFAQHKAPFDLQELLVLQGDRNVD